MGSYTFTWEHPAEEVYVTGTFDDWTKSVKLEKEGDVFQKTVDLKDASKKIYFKFVVDNTWTTNDSAPKEPDHEGNVNNFLTPEQIADSTPAVAAISTVGPDATTAKMAGEVPKEPKDAAATPSDVPGGFPETPANELDKPIGINPLPAADGAVNPVTLAPGENPAPATAQDINSNVKLDKESYEKSDALPGVASNSIDTAKPVIPESGLPVTDNTINSVGPTATTVSLAGDVPKEPAATVPDTVVESQQKAGVEPEASAVAEEVKEKAEVEDELKSKVPEAPATSSGTAGVGTEKTEQTGAVAGAAAAAGGSVAGAAMLAKGTIYENVIPAANQTADSATATANEKLPESAKEKLPVSAQETLKAHDKEETREEVSPEVPAEVKESLAEAHQSPEAAANTSAVVNKEHMESELLKEVKPVPAADETKGKEASADPKPVEPVTDAGTAAEPLKPQEEKTVEETPKQETTTEEASKDTSAVDKPKEEKSTEEKLQADKAAEKSSTPANGSESKPAESTSSAAGQKKKNRLSMMLSKIKHKISDK